MARNREKEPIPVEKDETILNGGYSETQQAQDIEARSGDLTGMKRSRGGIQDAKPHAKTLGDYKEVSQNLSSLIEQYVLLLEKDLRQAQKMLGDIESLRKQQKDLLDSIFGEHK